ncbi:glucan biosynthesis protein G [Aestuariivita sp.]|jgi:glucans biosynthesis protein|uniref:glucan biosynthesis protein n=1 Tax=Aestuariivita sp. TaxID=1872407 RepID=UPI00216ED66B|nr:glucan biosynthesis protein G [Aestuariivita sp.]MCE8005695.1 glucan biosynthesis protein G [Aestuariivita sp.]
MISRRAFLAGLGVLPIPLALAGASVADTPFSHDTVIERARALAQGSYTPRATVPEDWINLTYDQYRKIWFRNADALWSGTDRPYNVDFFHPGLYFPRPVEVNTVTDGMAEVFPFDYSLFDTTDKVPPLTVDDSLGYSGLRLRTQMGQPGIKEEFAVFQGASYFRAIGAGQIYGLSARGLALKTAEPSGEEFPDFVAFWLEAPAPEQRHFVLHALLDSPSVTGAYRFTITPGADCVMDVEATLFAREDLTHVGLAPLTSMFKFDETNRQRFNDFRPAVHDTDGLMILNGAGEVLWRPLANPRHLQISGFVDQSPRGFGLMQRARRQSHFADLEALYHRRPGLWVEPKGDWGRGSVTLVEIPTDKEIYDNIVAYWRPAEPVPAGDAMRLAYRLTWGAEAPVETGLPRVINTRMGNDAFNPGIIAAIDFEAHPLFDEGPEGLSLHIQSAQADTTPGILQRNPETGGLRLSFRFDPGDASVVELRAQLRKTGAMASEVWLYRWTA